MIYNVYEKWMSDNNGDQLSILNTTVTDDTPSMPQASFK
ncbi:defective integrase [Pectobacterium zantedeschiae]|uniref:Defective integrase n=1 Tax=Pectobacterium zantedeschiae TaxID=2034769 RepID=A0A9X8P5H9_9GAMM|nr:defective integrase [Pectobacterium zantedeschiae]RYC44486.1 defective integrase [Pectobacterium zantedeschiae]RYC49644.1 defective integrase [Pectobacterium zantedeschiae]